MPGSFIREDDLMARKILLRTIQGSAVLEELAAPDEAQLQELLKENPQLLPVEEFELTGLASTATAVPTPEVRPSSRLRRRRLR